MIHLNLDRTLFVGSLERKLILSKDAAFISEREFFHIRLYFLYGSVIRYYEFSKEQIEYEEEDININRAWLEENKIKLMIFFKDNKTMVEFKLNL